MRVLTLYLAARCVAGPEPIERPKRIIYSGSIPISSVRKLKTYSESSRIELAFGFPM